MPLRKLEVTLSVISIAGSLHRACFTARYINWDAFHFTFGFLGGHEWRFLKTKKVPNLKSSTEYGTKIISRVRTSGVYILNLSRCQDTFLTHTITHQGPIFSIFLTLVRDVLSGASIKKTFTIHLPCISSLISSTNIWFIVLWTFPPRRWEKMEKWPAMLG